MNITCHSERSEGESRNLSVLAIAVLSENPGAFVRSLTPFGMTKRRHHVAAA
jgi:hypothetical protein